MAVTQDNNECPAILTGLASLTAKTNYNTATGILGGLLSPSNRGAGAIEVKELASKNGHNKKVRVSFRRRQTPDDVLDTVDCNAVAETPWIEENASVALFAGMKWTFSYDTIRLLCEQYSEWVRIGRPADGIQIRVMEDLASQIAPDLDAIRQKIAKDAHTALLGYVGGFANGDASPNTYSLLNTANGSLNYKGFAAWRQDLDRVSSGLRPIVVGDNNMYKAVMAMGYGCCNDAGIDFDKMARSGTRFDFYHDVTADYLGDYGNANAFGMWIPGNFQFVPTLENVGNFAGKIDNVTYGTMPDTLYPGLTYDMKLIESGCDKTYTLAISVKYDFWGMPNIFKAGDRLNNVTGIFTGIAAEV
jgi:hypothetical protein